LAREGSDLSGKKAKMPKKGAAAIPQTEDMVSAAKMATALATVVRIVAQIQGDLAALQQFSDGPSRKSCAVTPRGTSIVFKNI
jgi:hypothetical protein